MLPLHFGSRPLLPVLLLLLLHLALLLLLQQQPLGLIEHLLYHAQSTAGGVSRGS
jgi:hypothetical protein